MRVCNLIRACWCAVPVLTAVMHCSSAASTPPRGEALTTLGSMDSTLDSATALVWIMPRSAISSQGFWRTLAASCCWSILSSNVAADCQPDTYSASTMVSSGCS